MSQLPITIVIHLWPHTDECCVCGLKVTMRYGLPMYEDQILPADWKGPWAGFTACQGCYERFSGIDRPMSVSECRKELKP
jgi:hypothetical protein